MNILNIVFLNIVFLNIVFLNIVNSKCISCTRFNPSCTTCKFFIPKNINKDLNDNTLGLCEIFEENINNKLIKNLAIHCRNDESLCGKSGKFYEPKTSDKNTYFLLLKPF